MDTGMWIVVGCGWLAVVIVFTMATLNAIPTVAFLPATLVLVLITVGLLWLMQPHHTATTHTHTVAYVQHKSQSHSQGG